MEILKIVTNDIELLGLVEHVGPKTGYQFATFIRNRFVYCNISI